VMHEAEWVGAVAAEQALRQGAKEILDEH